MANYPTSLDNFTNPTSGNNLNSPSHSQQHSDANDAIEALEAKVGIGASTPTTNKVLRGTGTGDSAWGNVVEADISLSDNTTNDVSTTKHGFVPKAPNDTTKVLRGDGTWATVASMDTAPPNLLKNGNFINNSTNGYGSTPDDWTSSNANPVQGGIPALTKQNLIDGLGITDGDIEGLWNLNGDLNDLSSNGYNLTPSASAPTDSSDGLMAQCKVFAAASTQYAYNAAANCNISGSQTIVAFIKPTAVGTVIRIAGIRASGGGNSKGLLVLANGAIRFDCGGATPGTLDSDVVVAAGKWNKIVGVVDTGAGKIKLWVNGVKKETALSGTPGSVVASFAIGRYGDNAGSEYNGSVQNVIVLSMALSDNQVKKLFAMTMYSGQKIRRATTDGYLYQDLPMDLVERLRGKTVALRAEMYQEVASTGQISILQTLADGTTSESIISATDATTGSWLEKLATGTISSTAVGIQIRLKHSTSDGNTWFKKVSLYEGSILLPYDHSKDDWSRFPRLLRMDIPAVISGYQFEEKRPFAFDSIQSGFSSNPSVNNFFTIYGNEISFIVRPAASASNAANFDMSLPAVPYAGNASGYQYGMIAVHDNGAWQNSPGIWGIADNVPTVKIGKTISSTSSNVFGGFTASGNKAAEGEIRYRIA
jgi:hypothetical protein